MKQKNLLISLSFLLFLTTAGSMIHAQLPAVKTKFGAQFKPIIPNRFIGQYEQLYSREGTPDFSGSFRQTIGYSAGIAIRHQFSRVFSLETAINFVKRNYDFTYESVDSGYAATSSVGFIGYDIPINGLVYVRVAEQWYMNASAGLNIGFYPTSVESFNEDANTKVLFKQITSPTRRIQLGLNINYGFEYRVKEVGDFYLGASYALPFSDIAVNQMTWVLNGSDLWVREGVNGSFLTLDFKYFFPK